MDTDLAQYFDECFEFIEEAKRTGGAVLVHCFAGISRSVTIVLSYLMKKHHLSLSQALEHVKSKRPRASPNLGFLLQLQKLEKSLKDQASVIGGVIEFIKEMHQILQSLESQKQRKSLSPSPAPSPRPLHLLTTPTTPSPSPTSPFGFEMSSTVKELGACCNSTIADVEAKISGSNVILRTISKRIPGQILKIIDVLEKLSFEVLHLNISSMEDTVLYSFVIKIGLECQLSVEELAQKYNKASAKMLFNW
ncbi:hypothetical protein Sjap_007788 [Stephania japonica]|uniref:Uncharacterized protein n=1 Tax=Stephania japonica TaxID=461633 RepID=A0AAP0JNW1_9MAGN